MQECLFNVFFVITPLQNGALLFKFVFELFDHPRKEESFMSFLNLLICGSSS